MVFILSAFWQIRIRGLWKLPDGRDWLWEKLGFVTVGETGFCYGMLSKSIIQFSVDGQDCVPSLLFDLRPNYAGGNEDNGDLLQSSHARTATVSTPEMYPCRESVATLQQKYNWFLCVLILYSVSMINLFHVPSKKNIFISSIPICILFISLSCLIALWLAVHSAEQKRWEWISSLVSDLREKAFRLSLLSMTFIVSFWFFLRCLLSGWGSFLLFLGGWEFFSWIVIRLWQIFSLCQFIWSFHFSSLDY